MITAEELGKKHAATGKLKVLLVSTVGGGGEEEAATEELGITTAKRYSCIDLPPEYAIATPHVTVIHRSGLVVRNGVVGDLEPLVQAMLDEPDE